MEWLILGLLLLGAITAITLVSFAIGAVISAIVEKLEERNAKREILMPSDMATDVVEAVKERNPSLGQKLKDALEDDEEECKLGFMVDYEKNVVDVSVFKANDSSQDDIQKMTQIYVSGTYKTY